MARDHARIRLDIWSDEHWRDLTSGAQWLYMHLLTSPSLNFAGVCDWRPARIAAHSTDLDPSDVETYAFDLEDNRFVLIDRRTEEALIRSWVKHDGLMQSPNMAKALVKAYGETVSGVLRAVLVGQLQRLRDAEPDLRGWDVMDEWDLMDHRTMTPTEALEALPPNPFGNPSLNPSGNPSLNPSANGSATGSLNPSATPYSLLPNSLTPVLPDSSSSSVAHLPSPGAAKGRR